jgi:hypothetical protein
MTQPETGPDQRAVAAPIAGDHATAVPPAVPAQPPVPLAPPGITLAETATARDAAVPAPDPSAALYAPEPIPVPAWATSLDPAPVMARVFAGMIDFFLTFVVTVVVAAILLYSAVVMGFSGTQGAYAVLLLAFAVCALIPLVANALKVRQIGAGRQTRGKRMMRIAIVDSRTGGTVSIRRAIIRAAILLVPSLLTVGAINLIWDVVVGQSNPYGVGLSLLSPLGFVAPIVWIAVLVMMSAGDRRGLWDRAAGTRVVTAQSLWWAANDVPNPRLVSASAASATAAPH